MDHKYVILGYCGKKFIKKTDFIYFHVGFILKKQLCVSFFETLVI